MMTEQSRETFAERLSAEMQRRGYSLRNVAERMTSDGLGRVGHSGIGEYARGDRRPGPQNVVRLARVFHADPEEWLLLAGYPTDLPEGTVPEATLSPDEATIIEAFRLDDPDVQEHLLSAARLALRLRSGLGATQE